MNIDAIIEEFMNKIEIENSFFSTKLQQPVFLIAERKLYEAIKKVLERIKYANELG